MITLCSFGFISLVEPDGQRLPDAEIKQLLPIKT